MATFEAHIEGLTQIDITTSSAPTQDELTEFLQEALGVSGILFCISAATA